MRTSAGGDVKQNKVESKLRPGLKDKHKYRTEEDKQENSIKQNTGKN